MPARRWWRPPKPRSRSASTISSGSNTRMPLARSISGLSGRTVSCRATEVMIAIRPPGRRARRISSSAASGSAKRWRAAKQQEPGDPHLLGRAWAERALRELAECGAPPALVDRRDGTGEHQALRGSGRADIAADQVEVAAVVVAFAHVRPHQLAGPGDRVMGLGDHASAGDRARPTRLAGMPRQLLEAGDLTLALAPRRVVRRQPLDEAPNAIADLQREVRSGRPGEGPDVLGGGAAAKAAVRSLARAHASSPSLTASRTLY